MPARITLPSIHEMFPEHLTGNPPSPPPYVHILTYPSPTSPLPPLKSKSPLFASPRVASPTDVSPAALAAASPTFRVSLPEHAPPHAPKVLPSPPPSTGVSSFIAFDAPGGRPPRTVIPETTLGYRGRERRRAVQRAASKQPPPPPGQSTFPVSPGAASDGEVDDGRHGDRRHVCNLCPKRFNRPSSLRIHLNTHTGNKPFECPFPGCGRLFNVNSNMRRHLRNHSQPPPGSVAEVGPLRHPHLHPQKNGSGAHYDEGSLAAIDVDMDVGEYGRRRQYSREYPARSLSPQTSEGGESSYSESPSTPDEHRRASYEDSYERGRRHAPEEDEMDEDA